MATSAPYILMVEDQADTVFLMQRALKKAMVSNVMVVVRDGQEAIDYLERAVSGSADVSELPQLMLLDNKMPRMDGLEVLKWVRHHRVFSTLPVVMLTNSDNLADIQKARELGVTEYWVKTGDIKKLTSLARELYTRWLDRPDSIA
jgi:two-component system response regulator